MTIDNLFKKVSFQNIKIGVTYLQKYGLCGAKKLFLKRYPEYEGKYRIWIEQHNLTHEELNWQRNYKFAYEPLISLLVPVYNTPKEFLRQMILSVCMQTYSNWELCLVNANPRNDAVREILSFYEDKDSRIRVNNLDKNLGISNNTNMALSMAQGEYIGLVDHDDLLSPDALFEIVQRLNDKPVPQVIYSDEDKITVDGRRRFQPNFKPDFNLELLRSNNYICHFFVAEKELVNRVGGFKSSFEGAQDYDLILRCTELAKKIDHISKILYHWRVHEESTAANPKSKLYAYLAGKRTIDEHLKRCGEKGTAVSTDAPGFYHVKYSEDNLPGISIILINKNQIDSLKNCLKSIFKSNYKKYEILIIDCGSSNQKVWKYYEKISSSRIKILKWEKHYNYSTIINWAVKCAEGKYCLFMSGHTSFIDKGSLSELVANICRTAVGAVGGKIYYRNGSIRYAGTIFQQNGTIYNVFKDWSIEQVGYMHRESLQQNLCALSSECILVKKNIFEKLGGLDEKLGEMASVIDFCLKLRGEGKTVVFNPHVELFYERNKGEMLSEKCLTSIDESLLRKRWEQMFKKTDPAFNANLVGDYEIRTEVF